MRVLDLLNINLLGGRKKKELGDEKKYTKISSSGVENYSGYIEEDYLDKFRENRRAAKEYDKMRRQSAPIAKILALHQRPIEGAAWEITIKKQFQKLDEAKKERDMLSHILFDRLDKPWPKKVAEIVKFFEFGVSTFEETYRPYETKDFGAFIGLDSLSYISQKSIEQYFINKNEDFLGISQYAYGDARRNVIIPGRYLTMFAIGDEGKNFRGISLLRPIYCLLYTSPSPRD